MNIILTRKTRTFIFLGLRQKDKAGAKVTYFHNKIDDLISSQYQGRFGRTVRYQYINIDKDAMKGFESEVTYRFADDHWHAKLHDLSDAKMSSPKRLTGNARMNGLAELFYTTGKDNFWTMTRYNQWYRIISTAMEKLHSTARRTSSSP